MRRADRLFAIIQILRRSRRPVPAHKIAAELEVSLRTIYRDVADLIGQRVPIEGEAGVGYVLGSGFDLPPLMLNAMEMEAAVLGAQWVLAHGEPDLARAAQDMLAKLEAIAPAELQDLVREPAATFPPRVKDPRHGPDVMAMRAAIRAGRKLALRYGDAEGRVSDRVVWPILVGYRQEGRILAAWCELRRDFRWFLAARIQSLQTLDSPIPEQRLRLRARWRRAMDEERARRAAQGEG